MDITPTIGLKENHNPADTNKETKLRKACAGFEAIMLKEMLTSARRSMPKGGLWDGGHAEEMYTAMHDDFLAQKLAEGSGMGFGDLLYQQLSRTLPPQDK